VTWPDQPEGTDPGAPYVGPPPTAPPVYGRPVGSPWAASYPAAYPGWYGPGYGSPWGYPGAWGRPGPRRPGQVIAAAVLTFVQAGVVLLASLYVFLIAAVARVAVIDSGGPRATVDELVTEATVLAVLQAVSVVVLVVAGVLALGRRRPPTFPILVGALAAQVVLAIYWAVRLTVLSGDLPGEDPSAVFAWLALVFAAMPAVALGLVLLGPGRRWFREEDVTAP
jgi:hypothetical protein